MLLRSLLTALLAAALAHSAPAATIVVDSSADQTGSNGDCTLRDAIRAANGNVAVDACPAGQAPPVVDEIVVPAGIYRLLIAGINENAGLSGDLDITQSVTIRGAGRDATILDGGNLDRVLQVGGSTLAVTVRDLSIVNGCSGGGSCTGAGAGGVEVNAPGTFTLQNAIVSACRGAAGGGVHVNAPGTLAAFLTDVVIVDNVASALGGGVGVHNPTTIRRAFIHGNQTTSGGNGAGVAIVAGESRISESLIWDNTSTGNGGGIAVQGFVNTTFGVLNLDSSTLSANRAYANGGGLYVNGGSGGTGVGNAACVPAGCSARLDGVTLSANVADADLGATPGSGGGVYVNGSGAQAGILRALNSVVAGNVDPTGASAAAPDCAGAWSSDGVNWIGNGAGCSGSRVAGDRVGTAAAPLDPLLAPLLTAAGSAGTHAPLPGSPLIDAGSATAPGSGGDACPLLDQRGVTRPLGARCDLGAHEAEPATTCGDGHVDAGEGCDDGNVVTEPCPYGAASCSVCGATCRIQPGAASFCGDAAIDAGHGESCDDANAASGDGCSAACTTESGWICAGSPSSCTSTCGDGVVAGTESCDDGNTTTEFCSYGETSCTVCTASCQLQAGVTSACGDGVVDAARESCDDGNAADGDGCSSACGMEPGWHCAGAPSSCAASCGDGITAGAESCDDGNTVTETCPYGGASCTVCNATCQLQAGATSSCGDNRLDGVHGEECDDGNTANDDGCDSSCRAEQSFPSPAPLDEPNAPPYLGLYPLGLYAGSNQMPAAHRAAGIALANQVQPLDGAGNPSPTGRIVLMSVGMSNPTMEFCTAEHDLPPKLDPQNPGQVACGLQTFLGRTRYAGEKVNRTTLSIVAGSYVGEGTSFWEHDSGGTVFAPIPPNPAYPTVIGDYDRIRDLNLPRYTPPLSEAQVQVVWLKLVDGGPTVSLPNPNAAALVQVTKIGNVLRTLKQRYPNLRMAFLTSRSYGGYSNSVSSHREPYAYESGFTMKWLIQAQIDQVANGGSVVDTRAGDLDYRTGAAPWISWGPYLWANGETSRASDGLSWTLSEFAPVDQMHPGPSAQSKVGLMLLHFFESSPFTNCWFMASGECR